MRSYRTFSPLPVNTALADRAQGGVFSVALSLGSPPVGITDHPALRSPDFPLPPPCSETATTRPSPAKDILPHPLGPINTFAPEAYSPELIPLYEELPAPIGMRCKDHMIFDRMEKLTGDGQ